VDIGLAGKGFEEGNKSCRMGGMKKDTRVIQALRQVIDPELGVNIVDLGLVYGGECFIDETGVEGVKVEMTLTTPGCPLGGYFVEKVAETLAGNLGVEADRVEVKFVWDPPWIPDMMTEESKAELGLG